MKLPIILCALLGIVTADDECRISGKWKAAFFFSGNFGLSFSPTDRSYTIDTLTGAISITSKKSGYYTKQDTSKLVFSTTDPIELNVLNSNIKKTCSHIVVSCTGTTELKCVIKCDIYTANAQATLIGGPQCLE